MGFINLTTTAFVQTYNVTNYIFAPVRNHHIVWPCFRMHQSYYLFRCPISSPVLLSCLAVLQTPSVTNTPSASQTATATISFGTSPSISSTASNTASVTASPKSSFPASAQVYYGGSDCFHFVGELWRQHLNDK